MSRLFGHRDPDGSPAYSTNGGPRIRQYRREIHSVGLSSLRVPCGETNPASRVSVVFAADETGTRMRFVHSELRGGSDHDQRSAEGLGCDPGVSSAGRQACQPPALLACEKDGEDPPKTEVIHET